MASVTVKAAGGKSTVAATYEPEEVPTAATDVILASTSGSYEVSGATACRSIEASAYKKALVIQAVLSIGTSTSNAGKAFTLGAGMSLSRTAGHIEFVSTSGTVEAIALAGIKMPTECVFTGAAGKYKIEGLFESSASVEVLGTAELNTNGEVFQANKLIAGGTSALTLGASHVILTASTAIEVFKVASGVALSAGTSNIEITDTGTARKTFTGAGKTYSTVTITGNNVEIAGNNKIATLVVNTARVSTEAKGTTVEKSKTLTLTSGTLPTAGQEVRGTAIPANTTIVKVISEGAKTLEMSNEATSTVGVAETIEVFAVGLLTKAGNTQTVENFTTNGKATELARFGSSEAGVAASITKTGGTVSGDYLILHDSKAEGTASWYAGSHSTNVSGNTGWKFEAAPSSVTASGKVALTFTSASAPKPSSSLVAKTTLNLATSTNAVSSVSGKATSTVTFSQAAKASSKSSMSASSALRLATSSTPKTVVGGAGSSALRLATASVSQVKVSTKGAGALALSGSTRPAVKLNVATSARLVFGTHASPSERSAVGAATGIVFTAGGSSLTKISMGAASLLALGSSATATVAKAVVHIVSAGRVSPHSKAGLVLPKFLGGRSSPKSKGGTVSPTSHAGRVNPTEKAGNDAI